MKTLFTTLAVALICFLVPTTSSAQNPDICKPDCDSSEFGITKSVFLETPDGCIMKVDFAQRNACGIYNDVGIIAVELLTPCGYPADPKTLLEWAADALIKADPMGFGLTETNECFFSWRVVKGACWEVQLDCDHESLFVPCDSVACCLSPIEVCRDSAGTIVVTQYPGSSNIPCDTLNYGCESVCGDAPVTVKGGGPDLGYSASHAGHGILGSSTPRVPESPKDNHEDHMHGLLSEQQE